LVSHSSLVECYAQPNKRLKLAARVDRWGIAVTDSGSVCARRIE